MNKYKIVTLDGQVVNVGGSITGGSLSNNQNLIKDKYDLEIKQLELNNLINKNNNFIDFDYGFSASHIKLINDSYSYTLTINFSLPITYVDNLGNYSLVSSLSFKI